MTRRHTITDGTWSELVAEFCHETQIILVYDFKNTGSNSDITSLTLTGTRRMPIVTQMTIYNFGI